ncbi:hypothetical protein L596_028146 [Steinernema carpocapsae]|uniref:RING-type domain-containing protein n=1 Tax=Steinernema carpocapsae TaxID=34508 RepID=A0A4U5LXM1_STECR|nr:hypothetical protein L596_028146 [Steinernema carpocapsae]
MSDFVHCNSCLRLPNSGGLFFVGNCNLCILCQKCVQKTVVPQANVQDAEKPHMCIICKKPGKFHQISGDMPANVMNFFRDPKQLCENFMKQIKQVLDFRNAHRTRLIKVQGEQFKKCAVEFKKLQEETKRSIEREKTARVEVQRYQEQIKTAKRKLEEDELEIARLKELLHQQRNTQHLLTPHRIALMTPKRHRPDSGFSSVGTDPNDESVLSDVDKFVNNVATEKSASPIHVDETIVSIPIPSSLPMTTPAMLGIGQARARSRSKQRSVHARRDRADYF